MVQYILFNKYINLQNIPSNKILYLDFEKKIYPLNKILSRMNLKKKVMVNNFNIFILRNK